MCSINLDLHGATIQFQDLFVCFVNDTLCPSSDEIISLHFILTHSSLLKKKNVCPEGVICFIIFEHLFRVLSKRKEVYIEKKLGFLNWKAG